MDNPSAFPVVCENGLGHVSDGMTLRDWFAGQFLSGAATDNSPLDVPACADEATVGDALREAWGHAARAAYIAADAMLAERAKVTPSHG